MLTIKAVIKKLEQKTDGTFNVKLRFTLNRKVKCIATSLFVSSSDLTRNGDFKKSTPIKMKIDKLVTDYRIKCSELQLDTHNYSLDQILLLLKYSNCDSNKIDFIQFCRQWISTATIKGASNYTTAVNSFARFLGKDYIECDALTKEVVCNYKAYLDKERGDKAKALVADGKRVTSNRAVTLYLVSLKRLYKELQKKYNHPELNIIPFPQSPFDFITIPKQEATRKRALPVETIKKIYELPYHNTKKGIHNTCRYDLAKDMFLLSFCLIGMNSVDLYNATELDGNILSYNRSKTKDRRLDEAKMVVTVPDIVMPIIEKYKDKTGKRLFSFYKNYADHKAFNKAINKGLKDIGTELEIEDLEFYAARHSWATIALNKCHIDKYTVHAALNHVDPSMRVTDIYIERDFVNENEANNKVLEYVFGK